MHRHHQDEEELSLLVYGPARLPLFPFFRSFTPGRRITHSCLTRYLQIQSTLNCRSTSRKVSVTDKKHRLGAFYYLRRVINIYLLFMEQFWGSARDLSITTYSVFHLRKVTDDIIFFVLCCCLAFNKNICIIRLNRQLLGSCFLKALLSELMRKIISSKSLYNIY